MEVGDVLGGVLEHLGCEWTLVPIGDADFHVFAESEVLFEQLGQRGVFVVEELGCFLGVEDVAGDAAVEVVDEYDVALGSVGDDLDVWVFQDVQKGLEVSYGGRIDEEGLLAVADLDEAKVEAIAVQVPFPFKIDCQARKCLEVGNCLEKMLLILYQIVLYTHEINAIILHGSAGPP